MTKQERDRRHDAKRREQYKWRALYKSKAWQALRLQVLARDLFICQRTGVMLTGARNEPNAPVVHHIKDHKGDPALFFDPDNCQSVAKSVHDADIQREEAHGYSDDIGEDGMPTDPRHPFNA